MKIQRKATTIGALMIAAGAVVTGASITSGAMAADSATDDATVSAVVIGSASADGDAYQCVFDDVELPTIAVGTDGETADGGAQVSGSAVITGGAEALPLDGVEFTIDEDGNVVDANGEIVPGVSVEAGEGVVTGGALVPDGAVAATELEGSGVLVELAPGESTAVAIDADGQVVIDGPVAGVLPTEMVEVRDGTAEECASLLEQTQITPAVPAPQGSTIESPAP